MKEANKAFMIEVVSEDLQNNMTEVVSEDLQNNMTEVVSEDLQNNMTEVVSEDLQNNTKKFWSYVKNKGQESTGVALLKNERISKITVRVKVRYMF